MEKITIEFFKRRFPEKDIEFEKECGYFGEWVKRFESGHPETWMDEMSLKVWRQMNDGYSYVCSLCGEESFGYGNNPFPLNDGEGECCDQCNSTKVIPARLRSMKQ